MKVVTSVTVLNVAAGQKMSITHSEIDEEGKIIADNIKTARIIKDDERLAKINAIVEEAQKIIDATE